MVAASQRRQFSIETVELCHTYSTVYAIYAIVRLNPKTKVFINALSILDVECPENLRLLPTRLPRLSSTSALITGRHVAAR